MPETLTKVAPPDDRGHGPACSARAALHFACPTTGELDDATLEQLDELNPGWRIERGFAG